MPIVEIHTVITAPIERVFDLCRSVDVHVASAGPTGERAVGGVTSGLLGPGEQVTWSARHFGWRWRLTSRITAFERPRFFRDSLVDGVLARFDHDHEFETRDGVTHVRDRFDFASRFGPIGRLADALFVARHMRAFLARRMATIRRLAESDGWRRFLPEH